MGNLDKETQSRINQWLTNEYDLATVAEVQQLVDNNEETELLDSFYKELEFGTGGLRGIMGVGSNRMNKYTIGKATQGLANYLIKQFPGEDIKVAVSYDSRNNSQAFGNLVADVFSANGIHVYLFKELRPTPVLSFAVRHFHCQGGVMLTASHNPKEYNGYKAYWNDGGQLVAPHDKNVISEVNAIQSVNEIKFDRDERNITLVGEDFDDIYIAANTKLSIHPEAVQAQKDLKIVYSPIHGTGITVVPKILKAWGFEQVTIVDEQAEPNGNFPTVIYPNPEEEEAMAKAKQKGQDIDADVVMATDPDADRVGVAIKTPSGTFQLINGNQIGSLLSYYVLSSKKALGQLKPNDYIVKTIVTSNLFAAIADAHQVKYYETLTGFKYIGEVMTNLLGKENYLVGGEESYGYLVGDLVRDKDAVNSCAFIAEMTAYFKSQGKSLYDVLIELYLKYGFYKEKLISLTKKGKAGADEIKQMMADLRANLPKSLGDIEVVEVRDYQLSETTDMKTGKKSKIDLPKSDVLQFITIDGDVISARPSGTEPKIKFYCSVKEKLSFSTDYGQVSNRLDDKVDVMMADIIKD
ncbi:phospho-sugar mutase [Sphingobacterium sp. DK4209]|uniref:Phospho-sugar mutase n=1 Tax=Sphingobacterium zhuxiongii TaxID=2662364 RepID=A0A5Q0QB68_9SPHI|nr:MULTISPECIES: phospho-sugar mutase [unclassified Sphingobacterium]MVZ65803.1 phospho-sugar mutase [Sphingobacterium sp. DK4209]QGA24852.1 phospho-sugar mutase [Sphingobacterium sp. dk4302]